MLMMGAGLAPFSAAQAAGQPPGSELTASPAAARDMQRPELQALLPEGRLIGSGRLRFWGFLVYDVRLWASPGFKADSFATQALALELNYLRSFDSQSVAERSITEMRRSAPISDELAEKWMAAMRKVLPDVKKGDRLIGLHRPGVGASFWMNGLPIGDIRDAEFAKLFFGIWLSPNTSAPSLRRSVLSGAGT